ncbi:MAG TPA: acyl-CoA dehydrogenase family protein, partial [Acidimicrobiia bacterium]|nr:acyl-CoA dehydrogenase family protein [Acidimicrobiia bacterium]
MQRDLFEPEHDMFRESFRRFLDKEVVPRAEEFERDGIMDRAIFAKAGAAGFLAMEAPEEYGGGGVKDFRYNTVIIDEVAETAIGGSGLGLTLHNDICLPYFLSLCNDEQKQRWLPGICS